MGEARPGEIARISTLRLSIWPWDRNRWYASVYISPPPSVPSWTGLRYAYGWTRQGAINALFDILKDRPND